MFLPSSIPVRFVVGVPVEMVGRWSDDGRTEPAAEVLANLGAAYGTAKSGVGIANLGARMPESRIFFPCSWFGCFFVSFLDAGFSAVFLLFLGGEQGAKMARQLKFIPIGWFRSFLGGE